MSQPEWTCPRCGRPSDTPTKDEDGTTYLGGSCHCRQELRLQQVMGEYRETPAAILLQECYGSKISLTVEDGALPADTIGIANVDSVNTSLVGETVLHGINFGVFSNDPISVDKIVHRPPPPAPPTKGNRAARRGDKKKPKKRR